MYRLSSTYDSSRLFYFGQLGRTFRDNFRAGRRTQTECTDRMPDPARGCTDIQSYMVYKVFDVCTGIEDLGDMGTNDTNSSSDSNDTSSNNQTVEPRTQTTSSTSWNRESLFIQERGRYRYNFTNNWMYSTALMGGHAIGGMNFTRSGYWGNFTGNITSDGVTYDTGTRTFSNEYYKQMLLQGWGQELNINGTSNDMWKIYDYSWNQTGFARRLLQSDLCLAYEDVNNEGKFLYSNSSDCCAWTEDDYLFNAGILTEARDNYYCGGNIQFSTDTYSENRFWCCRNQTGRSAGDCNDPSNPAGPGIDWVKEFTYSEAQWFDTFARAWEIATSNGHF